MKTKVVQVLLRRSETSDVAHVVEAHEIPVLKIARGAGNVTVTDVDCKGYEMKPRDVAPRDALIQLKRKYKGFVVDGQHPVDVAYPDGSRDIELFYKEPERFDNVGDDFAEEDAFEEVDQGPDEPQTVTPEEQVDLTEQKVDPVTNVDPSDRGAVMGALNARTIPYAKTTGTANLHTLLKKSIEAEGSE